MIEDIQIEDLLKLSKKELLSFFPKDFFFNKEKPPYHHQLASILWAYCREKADVSLFLDMGTGKTFVSINTWRLKGYKNRILVLTVNDTLAEQWVEEITEFSGYKSATVLGSCEDRLKVLDDPSVDCFVMNYDGLLAGKWMREAGKKKRKVARDKQLLVLERLLSQKWNAIVLDESRRIKNQSSTRTKAVLALGRKARHREILTGTPMVKPEDIFSQFRFVNNGKIFGNNLNGFRKRYFVKKGWSYFSSLELRKDMEEEFKSLVHSNSIRFTKDECFDLPDKKFVKVPIKLSSAQMHDYFALMLEDDDLYIADLSPRQLENKFIKYQQITGGFFKVGPDSYRYYDDNAKLDVCMDLVEDAMEDTKILIFHNFVEEGRLIEDRLKKLKIKFTSMRGEIKDKDAERKKFKTRDEVRVMVSHPKSGGIGLNLTEASIAIYYSHTPDLEAIVQSRMRIDRLGQTKKTTYYELVARNTIDESIYKAHEKGIGFMEDVMVRPRFVDIVRGAC